MESRWDSEEALFARAVDRAPTPTSVPQQYDRQIAGTILPILGVVKQFKSWQICGPEAGALLWKIMLLKAQLDAAPAPDLGGFKTKGTELPMFQTPDSKGCASLRKNYKMQGM